MSPEDKARAYYDELLRAQRIERSWQRCKQALRERLRELPPGTLTYKDHVALMERCDVPLWEEDEPKAATGAKLVGRPRPGSHVT